LPFLPPLRLDSAALLDASPMSENWLTLRKDGGIPTIFLATPAASVIAPVDPLPFVRDWVLLPFGIERHVLAPPAAIPPSALATRPPTGSCAVEVAVR
jgi:hypothetical protein